MNITVFLAQLWGPVLCALGVGVFTSRRYYLKLYHDLEKETLAVLVFSMTAMAAGIAQILFHNVWNTLPEVIVSLLGWGLFLKGALFAVAPKVADRGGEWAADSKLLPVIGIVVLVIGVYLAWFGYFA